MRVVRSTISVLIYDSFTSSFTNYRFLFKYYTIWSYEFRKDDYMKSEAFLNLAKAYEKLADFSKALSYGKASLQHPSMDSRTPGYAHFSKRI